MDPTTSTPEVIAVAAAQLAPHVTTGPAAQGDVLVLPWPDRLAQAARAAAVAAGEEIPPAGRTVLVGTTHAHTLHTSPDPAATWTPTRPRGLTLGVLAVPPEGLAVLGHPDHGDIHIGPGVWVLRRQRTATLTTPRSTPSPALAPVMGPEDPGYAAWID
jgi:hypothetical protein